MDATHARFAYRCLPLAIANAHGWELLCPHETHAVWDGGEGLDAIRVTGAPGQLPSAISHFGHGVLTFHVPVIFRTEPGWDLMVSGPTNAPKDAIAPLSGVVETDWAPFSFTMNWRFTRSAQRVGFAAGEPFCHIYPVQRGVLEEVTPTILPLSAAPDLARRHREWSQSRGPSTAISTTPTAMPRRPAGRSSIIAGRMPRVNGSAPRGTEPVCGCAPSRRNERDASHAHTLDASVHEPGHADFERIAGRGCLQNPAPPRFPVINQRRHAVLPALADPVLHDGYWLIRRPAQNSAEEEPLPRAGSLRKPGGLPHSGRSRAKGALEPSTMT